MTLAPEEAQRALFFTRLEALRQTFGLTTDTTACVAICVGALADAPDNQKTVGLSTHLLAAQIEKQVIIVTATQTDILFDPAVAAPLRALFPGNVDMPSSVFLHELADVNPSTFQSIMSKSSLGLTRVFVVQKEVGLQTGAPVVEAFTAYLKGLPENLVQDIPVKFSEALMIKDDKATECLRKSGAFAVAIMKSFLTEYIDDIFAEEREVPMSEISSNVASRICDARQVKGLEGVKSQNYTLAFNPPVVNSGGGGLKINAVTACHSSDNIPDRPLTPDVVIVAYGVKYTHYVTYIARTYLYNSTAEQQKVYSALLSLLDTVTATLVPGAVIQKVVMDAREEFKKSYPSLENNLTKTFGFSTGLEVLDKELTLSDKNKRTVEAGMTFVVRIGLENLRDSTTEKNYSMLLAETVIVEKTETKALTAKATSELAKIVKRIKTHAEIKAEESKAEAAANDGIAKRLRETARADRGVKLEDEMSRQEELKRLIEQRKAEAAAGIKTNIKGEEKDFTEVFRLAKGALKTYASVSDFGNAKADCITVEKSKETVLLPGLLSRQQNLLMPIHVSAVKSSEMISGGTTVLRFQLGANTDTNSAYRLFRTAVFLKEISYEVKNSGAADQVTKDIKAVQATIKAREVQRKQQGEVVEQKGLIYSKTRDVMLRDVCCFPNPRVTTTGRGAMANAQGNLVAHENGLQYEGRDLQQPMIVLYNNVKRCIFMPADNDPKVIVHFHLKKPIQIGKKKSADVQFFLTVVDESEALHVAGSTWENEVAQEERDRDRIKRFNKEFQSFTLKLEPLLQKFLPEKIELPIRRQTFIGTNSANKGAVLFKVSDHTVFSLVESPPFVQVMEEVEIAVFERAQGKNFDLTFVRTDYTVSQITVIDQKYQDSIKDWLNHAKVPAFECGTAITWKQVFKDIKDLGDDWNPWSNPGWASFFGRGGIGDDSDEETDEDSDEGSDSEFVMDSSEEEEDSEDETDSALISGDGSATSDSDDSSVQKRRRRRQRDEEEGMDWSDMEAQAEKEDREKRARGELDDSEDSEAPRRKKPAAKKAPPKQAGAKGPGAPAQRSMGGTSAGPPRPGAPMKRPVIPPPVQRPMQQGGGFMRR